MKSKKSITSLEKGLFILNCFSNQRKSLTLTEISKITGLHKATVQRYLYTLSHLGYLEITNKKAYRPTLKVLKLGFEVINNISFREQCSIYLENLSKNICQTVNLSMLLDSQIALIERFEFKRVVNYELRVGSLLPIHCTSSGKAILSFLPTDKIEKILNKISFEKFTKYTITDKEKLLQELEETRKRKYSLQNQEFSLNSRSTGAPILFKKDNTLAAISIVTNASDFSIQEVEKYYSPIVVETAKKLSNN